MFGSIEVLTHFQPYYHWGCHFFCISFYLICSIGIGFIYRIILSFPLIIIFRIIPVSIDDYFQNYSCFHWWLFSELFLFPLMIISELFLFPLMIIFRIIPVFIDNYFQNYSCFNWWLFQIRIEYFSDVQRTINF